MLIIMKDLSFIELKSIDGGNVPSAYYMDSDVIQQVGSQTIVWCGIVGRVALGMGKEIIRALCL
jgi:hypothetical protein